LETRVISKNCIHEETERRPNSEHVYYQFVILASMASIENSKGCSVKENIILSVILCGCEAGSVAVREEQKSREFGKEPLQRIFDVRDRNHPHEGENHKMRTFVLVFFVKHDEGDHVINYERGRAFHMRTKDEKCD
jgi:hypothetical protein